MPSTFRRIVAAAALCVALLPAAEARKIKQTPPPQQAAPPEKITTVEGITEYRLANGLRVLLFPDGSKQTITVNITYLVGSRHENYGETGMAHLLEHMVFKGSTNHREILTELAAHGARPNGTTSWDRTNYFETFNASDENLRWALSLEADSQWSIPSSRRRILDSEMTGGAQRVRDGREQPDGRVVQAQCCPWPTTGTTTATCRSARARTSKACRSTRLQAVLQDLLPARQLPSCWSPASSTSRRRWRWCRNLSVPIPRPTRALPVKHTSRAGAGRRTPDHAASRG
jgi:zinc protease